MAVACTLPVPCSLVLFARLSHRCALALPLGTRTINAWDTLEQTSDAKGNAASSGEDDPEPALALALAPPARPSAALGPVPVGAPQPPSPAGAPASPPPKRPRPDAEGVQPPPPKRPVPGAADGAAGAGAAGDLAPASQSALATAPAPTPTALKVVRGVLPPGTVGPSFPKPKAPARRSQPLAMPAMLNAMHRSAAWLSGPPYL